MSQLLPFAKAFRAQAQASRDIAAENPTWAPQYLVAAAVHDRTADLLEAKARAECSGEDRRGEIPLGRKR